MQKSTNFHILLWLLIEAASLFLTWSIIGIFAIIAYIQCIVLIISLRIPTSSAPWFHLRLLVRLLGELKRWDIIAGKEVNWGDCKTGEKGIGEAWWEPLVLLVIAYWYVLVIDWDRRHHTVIWDTMHAEFVNWACNR